MGTRHRGIRVFLSTSLACIATAVALFESPNWCSSIQAKETKRDEASKTFPAKNASAKGLLIRREGPVGSPWIVVEEGEKLPTGNVLLGLPGTIIDSANGALHVNMRSDLESTSPFPIVEN